MSVPAATTTFFTFQHNLDFPTGTDSYHPREGDFPSCFFFFVVQCHDEDDDCPFSLLLITDLRSVFFGRLLNAALCVVIVRKLFSLKLNEPAVMHFDLQFNNLIWDSKLMSFCKDYSFWIHWAIFQIGHHLLILVWEAVKMSSYNIPILMSPIIEKHVKTVNQSTSGIKCILYTKRAHSWPIW